MTDDYLQKQNRLTFYRDLVSCCYNLYSWTFSATLAPVFTNCPNDLVFRLIFSMNTDHSQVIDSVIEKGAPVVMTNSLGLMWISDFETDSQGTLQFIHVLGPAFYDDISPRMLEAALDRLNLSQSVKHQFYDILMQLPVVPAARFLQYGQMLHFTLTGKNIPSSEFLHMADASDAPTPKKVGTQKTPQHGTWAAEQAMMKLIEEGNLNYRKERDRFTTSGKVGKMSLGDPVRQVKNQIIVLTALCTRAAIRGGLAPDTAYTLSDRYIQNVEACTTIADLAEVGHAMEDDFVRRVHQVKTQTGISSQVQQCCEYIQLHVEDKITVDQLAQQVGHAKNYLIKKFHKETGKTIGAYITDAKMERAKLLLKEPGKSVQDIAEQLGYATQSHFGELFRKHTGMTPAQWR